jgi:hypothetical protein
MIAAVPEQLGQSLPEKGKTLPIGPAQDIHAAISAIIRRASVIDRICVAATAGPDDEMAAAGQRYRLDIQLVYRIS